MRDENQCLHERDAHAPLAFASHTIFPLKLDFAAEKGGMAVSAVWRLVYFLAPCPSEPKEQTAAHRRDALCPSPKIQKQAAFGITTFPHTSGCLNLEDAKNPFCG